MKKVRIERTETSDQGTFGTLYIDDVEFCKTGELPKYAGNPDVLNERCADCIPAGLYKCAPYSSVKYPNVYEVTGVPNRSAILIHSGNYCGDVKKGYKSHVLGCIILGKSMGILDGQKAVLSSKPTLEKFLNMFDKQPFTLEIRERF